MIGARVQRLIYQPSATRHWLRITRSLAAFYRRAPVPVPPMAIAWEISYRCDCRCPFCNTHELARSVRTLPREQAMIIAKKIADARVPFVTLSGGEPLLVPYWPDIARVMTAAGSRVSICTNGSRLPFVAEQLVEVGIRTVTVSVDDMDGSRHDEVRRLAGLSEAIAEGLARLRSADPGKSVAVRVRMAVTPGNFRQMADFVAMWKERVDEVSFQPVEDSGEGHIHHLTDAYAGFRPEDEPEFRRELERLFARFPEFDTPYYRRMPGYLFAHEKTRQSFQCLLPAVGFKIRADGHGITCANGAVSLGDLVTQPLAEVWNSKPLCALRSDSRAGTRSCYCWSQPTAINYQAPELVRRALMVVTGAARE